ncbi:MAG: hypothetical protein J0I77_05340 [Rudaea sp.]|uniref:hypothetical protein n=1 Tax=unclassified Rudaea TaxID=2627037 RepID=UPI0010F98278|nr:MULTISPECIES: hypothetical protein [unclassified Rudaea]MBN8885122.1 hypothetical protein [Rudaea sp.]
MDRHGSFLEEFWFDKNSYARRTAAWGSAINDGDRRERRTRTGEKRSGTMKTANRNEENPGDVSSGKSMRFGGLRSHTTQRADKPACQPNKTAGIRWPLPSA